MPIPNLKLAEAKTKLTSETPVVTIACISCKQPLWRVTIKGQYGTRVAADKEPYPGVPEYSEYWAKDCKTALRTDCPLCGEHYCRALMGPNGIVLPKVYCPEIDGA